MRAQLIGGDWGAFIIDLLQEDALRNQNNEQTNQKDDANRRCDYKGPCGNNPARWILAH